MDSLQKAFNQLQNNDMVCKIENDELYILVGESYFELSEFEVKFQAKLYDEIT